MKASTHVTHCADSCANFPTIVDGITHVTKRKFAFTLAEVLITLGIIGVVAAMTLPVIHAKIQRIIFDNQFKKSYSALSNAFQKVSFDMMDTECYYKDYEDPEARKESGCKDFFYNYLAQNLKTSKVCETNSFENGCLPDYKWTKSDIASTCGVFASDNIKQNGALVLNDGSIIFIAASSTTAHPWIGFDVNGFKGPNKSGYDVYAIAMTKVNNNNLVFRGPFKQGANGDRINITFCLPKLEGAKLFYDEIK